MMDTTMTQYDRDYSLYIGYGGASKREGILIKDLSIQFEVNKVINNQFKCSESNIKIFNLTPQQAAALQEHQVAIRLLAGYKNLNGLPELCLGNATKVRTTKSGTDRVTEITVGEAYSILNNTSVSGTVPAGQTIGDVIIKIAKDAGLTVGTFSGEAITTKVLWGYPLEGTTKQQLDEIALSYRLHYTVNSNRIDVSDAGGFLAQSPSKAFVLNEDTGLLDIPYFESWNEGKKKEDKTRVEGVCIKALLNPAIVPGKLIHLKRPKAQEQEVRNGFYLVRSAKYTGESNGNSWHMELKCDDVVLGDYQ